MERALFSWENWERLDDETMQFLGCKLVAELAGWANGCVFDAITINYATGVLTTYDADGNRLTTHKLRLQVVGSENTYNAAATV